MQHDIKALPAYPISDDAGFSRRFPLEVCRRAIIHPNSEILHGIHWKAIRWPCCCRRSAVRTITHSLSTRRRPIGDTDEDDIGQVSKTTVPQTDANTERVDGIRVGATDLKKIAEKQNE